MSLSSTQNPPLWVKGLNYYVESVRRLRKSHLARREAEENHRREMELKHGWQHTSKSTVGPNQFTSSPPGGFSVIVASFFFSVAIIACAVAYLLARLEPARWLEAYEALRLMAG